MTMGFRDVDGEEISYFLHDCSLERESLEAITGPLRQVCSPPRSSLHRLQSGRVHAGPRACCRRSASRSESEETETGRNTFPITGTSQERTGPAGRRRLGAPGKDQSQPPTTLSTGGGGVSQ